MSSKHNCVLPDAPIIASYKKLKGRRVVLASNSPRRRDILRAFGLTPEIVPSTFEENLPTSSFEDIHEYAVATATQKAVEVYTRLLAQNPDDAPELVIGADTVVLTHAPPSASESTYDSGPGLQQLLEKPTDRDDNLRMLLDLNGGICEVVTGVSIAYPILTAPGYAIKSIDERTLVYFADNPARLLAAYADTGEGMDRAGGFAIQGMGGMLIRKVDGDYNNVVGFPAASFLRLLEMLVEEDEDFLED